MTFRRILIPSKSGCGFDGSMKSPPRSMHISSEPGCGPSESMKIALRDTRDVQHGRDMLHMQPLELVQNTLVMGDTQNIQDMQHVQYKERVQHSQHTQQVEYMEHVRIRSNLIPAQEPESGLLPGANSADCLSHSLQDSKEC